MTTHPATATKPGNAEALCSSTQRGAWEEPPPTLPPPTRSPRSIEVIAPAAAAIVVDIAELEAAYTSALLDRALVEPALKPYHPTHLP